MHCSAVPCYLWSRGWSPMAERAAVFPDPLDSACPSTCLTPAPPAGSDAHQLYTCLPCACGVPTALSPACLQTRALWRFCRYLIVTAIPFKLVNDAAQFVGPLFLNLLLNVVSSGQPSYLGYSYAVLMFVLLVIGTLSDNQHFQRVMRAGGLGAASCCQACCSSICISCLGCPWQARPATDHASSSSCEGRWAQVLQLMLSGRLQHGSRFHACNPACG